MPRACCAVLVIIVLLTSFALAGDNKSAGKVLTKLPDGETEITDLKPAEAIQKCDNWTWAAALETVLAGQDVPLPQNYWILKANHGEVCVNGAADLPQLAALITGDYQLDDGRKLHLQARLTSGAPADIGALIASLQQRRPLVMFWDGRAYLLAGLSYEDYLYPNAQHLYIAKELRLFDPLKAGGDNRVTFTRGVDDASRIEGVLEVTVGPVEHFR